MYYINKRQDKLSKLDPKNLWSQILNHNTKENNIIPLREWNYYFKSLYKLPKAMDTIPIVPIKE